MLERRVSGGRYNQLICNSFNVRQRSWNITTWSLKGDSNPHQWWHYRFAEGGERTCALCHPGPLRLQINNNNYIIWNIILHLFDISFICSECNDLMTRHETWYKINNIFSHFRKYNGNTYVFSAIRHNVAMANETRRINKALKTIYLKRMCFEGQ